MFGFFYSPLAWGGFFQYGAVVTAGDKQAFHVFLFMLLSSGYFPLIT